MSYVKSDFVSWIFFKKFELLWRWKLRSIGLFWHSAQFIESFKSCPYLGWVKDGHFSFIQKSCQLGFILPPHPHFRFLRPCSVFHRGCRRILSGNSSIIWHPFLFFTPEIELFFLSYSRLRSCYDILLYQKERTKYCRSFQNNTYLFSKSFWFFW